MSDTIKSLLGDHNFDKVKASLAPIFPDGHITDDHVHAVVRAAWTNHHPQYEFMGIIPPPVEWEKRIEAWWGGLGHKIEGLFNGSAIDNLVHKAEDAFEPTIGLASPDAGGARSALYLARAHHIRTMNYNSNAPFQSEFTAQLDMVRLALPAKLSGDAHDKIKTLIGVVDLANDHILGSVEKIVARYGQELGFVPARVELISPARHEGLRVAFGATLYLGYKNAPDTAPTFYIAEGGMPTGEAKVVYLGKTMTTVIKAKAGFQVSPFANKDNDYVFTLVMGPGAPNEPKSLTIEAIRNGQEFPYVTTTVNYSRVAHLTTQSAAGVLLEAGLRVSLLGNAMGFHVFGAPSVIQDASAKAGSEILEWGVKPPFATLAK